MERIWLLQIIGIHWAIAKCEKRGKGCIHDVRHDQVGQHVPAWIVCAGWPGTDERPPEENRCTQKQEMFKLMPALMLEREVIRGGHMPAEEG